MLVCIICERVIVNFISKVHYACCSHCDVDKLTEHQQNVIKKVEKFASTGKVRNGA